MIVGLCTADLRIPMAHSLKDKRSVIKSLLERLKQKFNISAAEIGSHDLWQSSTIGIVTISNDRVFTDRLLDKVIKYIEDFNGIQLIYYNIEHL